MPTTVYVTMTYTWGEDSTFNKSIGQWFDYTNAGFTWNTLSVSYDHNMTSTAEVEFIFEDWFLALLFKLRYGRC